MEKTIEECLLSLQNGSDIRGIALENEHIEVNMQEENVRAIARGIMRWLVKDKNRSNTLRIAIGRDSRVTGQTIRTWLIDEFTKYGVHILDCDLATTPAMFMTTIWEHYDCHCGIMITASHLPYYYNGFKIFTNKGSTEKSEIREILTLASKFQEEDESEFKGSVKEVNLLEDYSNAMVRNIIKRTSMSKPLADLKIIVDAGNGAGGFFASKVLANLGANTTGSQFLEPDGMFPNHEPNPENKEAMRSISEAVLRHQADLGIIFDTDVDRAAIVTDDGKEINRNKLIAMISSIVLEEHPQSVIVTDSITSDGLTAFIEKKGGVHHRFKRGYKNVINESKRINEQEDRKSYLAIETSGHAALEENYFLDDGAYLVSKLLIELAKLHQEDKKLQSLIDDLKQPYESREYRIQITDNNFKEYGESVLEKFQKFAENRSGWNVVTPNFEGVKVDFGSGWILMRLSLHEPVLPINIETNEPLIMEKIMDIVKEFVKEQHGLNFNR